MKGGERVADLLTNLYEGISIISGGRIIPSVAQSLKALGFFYFESR